MTPTKEKTNLMKKLILILALMACVNVVDAAEENFQTQSMAMPPHIEFKDWGVYGILEYDFVKTFSWTFYQDALPESEQVEMPTFNSFTGVFGFQLRRQTGLGVGFNFLKDATDAFTQLPVFVELRSHYLRSRLTPFSVLQLGYSFPLGTSRNMESAPNHSLYIAQGGVMFGVQAGARYAFNRKFGISLNVGYMMLHANEVGRNDAYMVQANNESVLFHNFKAGLALNF